MSWDCFEMAETLPYQFPQMVLSLVLLWLELLVFSDC
jgi:hypothetical protein